LRRRRTLARFVLLLPCRSHAPPSRCSASHGRFRRFRAPLTAAAVHSRQLIEFFPFIRGKAHMSLHQRPCVISLPLNATCTTSSLSCSQARTQDDSSQTAKPGGRSHFVAQGLRRPTAVRRSEARIRTSDLKKILVCQES